MRLKQYFTSTSWVCYYNLNNKKSKTLLATMYQYIIYHINLEISLCEDRYFSTIQSNLIALKILKSRRWEKICYASNFIASRKRLSYRPVETFLSIYKFPGARYWRSLFRLPDLHSVVPRDKRCNFCTPVVNFITENLHW